MGNSSKWKESLAERTVMRQNANLEQLVYGKSGKMASVSDQAQASSEDEGGDDEFFTPKGEGTKVVQDAFNLVVSFLFLEQEMLF